MPVDDSEVGIDVEWIQFLDDGVALREEFGPQGARLPLRNECQARKHDGNEESYDII